MTDVYGDQDYDPEEQKVRGKLDAWINVSSTLVALFSFAAIFFWKFDVENQLSLSSIDVFSIPEIWEAISSPEYIDRVARFFHENGLAIILFVFTFFWYYMYFKTVRRELGILSTLFARLNPPKEYKALSGGENIGLLVVGFTSCFLLMAFLCDNLPAFIVIVLVLNAFDFNGNRLIRSNLRAFLDDPALKPASADPQAEFVLGRRRVAETYWLVKPQLLRIVIMMLVNAAALVLYLSPEIFRVAFPPALDIVRQVVAHLMVAGVIAWNEWWINTWRIERDADLRAINAAEARLYYPPRGTGDQPANPQGPVNETPGENGADEEGSQ